MDSSSDLRVSSYPAVVGEVLRNLRKSRGGAGGKGDLTQEDMAKEVFGEDAPASSWSRIESGKTALTIEQLAIAASKLNLAPSEILQLADQVMVRIASEGVNAGLTRNFAKIAAAAAAVGVVTPLAGPMLAAAVAAVFAKSGLDKESDLFASIKKSVLDRLGGIQAAAGWSREEAKVDKDNAA